MRLTPKRPNECANLAELRIELGKRRGAHITQRAMAKRIGVSASRLNQIEKGKAELNFYEVDKWAREYGAPKKLLADLFNKTRERWIHRRTLEEENPLLASIEHDAKDVLPFDDVEEQGNEAQEA